MKNIPIFDILFIILVALVFSLISYYGHSNIIAQFALIFALLAYYAGKFVGKAELRKKIQDKGC